MVKGRGITTVLIVFIAGAFVAGQPTMPLGVKCLALRSDAQAWQAPGVQHRSQMAGTKTDGRSAIAQMGIRWRPFSPVFAIACPIGPLKSGPLPKQCARCDFISAVNAYIAHT